MDSIVLIQKANCIERRFKRNCKRNSLFIKLGLPIILNISITIAMILLWPNCKLTNEDTEFLFHSEATREWFPDGIRGDNITGYSYLIVPNIVHYVLIEIREISFVHYISIKSVLKHQEPEQIIIHCDCDDLKGHYWEKLRHDTGKTKLSINRVKAPTAIFGRKIHNDWINWHGSDILRYKTLITYGGIYLDRDVYITKSFDPLRKYEMTIDVPYTHDNIGSQVLIAHKNARFLRLYLQTYLEYDPSLWYYNAGTLPYQKIILQYPHLVHSVDNEFGVIGDVICPKLYKENLSINIWRDKYYAFHLLMRGNTVNRIWCELPSPLTFDEENVKTSNVTFGQMVRLVLYNTTEIIK